MRRVSDAPRPRRWLLSAGALSALTLIAGCGTTIGVEPSRCVAAAPSGSNGSDEGGPSGDSGGGGRGRRDGPSSSRVLSRYSLALSPDGSLIAANQTWDRKFLELSVSDGTVIWDTADGSIVHRLDNGLGGAIAWHPTDDLLAVGGASTITLTDLKGTRTWDLQGHEKGDANRGIVDLTFSPDGSTLASLSIDGTVRLWATAQNTCEPGEVLNLRRLEPRSLSFSPDGSVLAICSPGRAPELWDPASGRRISRITDLDAPAHSLAFVPEGDLLIGTGDGDYRHTPDPLGLHVMDSSGKIQDGPRSPDWDVACIAPDSSGQRVAFGDGHNRIVLWDRTTNDLTEVPRPGQGAPRLAMSPDGNSLFGAGTRTSVRRWAGETWQEFEMP